MSLHETATTLVEPGMGILAADESHPTMAKRLAGVGLTSSEQVRKDYRELLIDDSGSVRAHQRSHPLRRDHPPEAQLRHPPSRMRCSSPASSPASRWTQGITPLPRFPDEVVTQGLDGLTGRLAEYASLGARFAKWRGVIRIGRVARPLPAWRRTRTRSHASPLRRRSAAWSRSSSRRS